MKKLFKTLAALAVVAALGFGFVSCGGGDDDSSSGGGNPGNGGSSTQTSTTATFKGKATVMGTTADVEVSFAADNTYLIKVAGENDEKGTYTLTGDFNNGTVTMKQTHSWKGTEWKEKEGTETWKIANGVATNEYGSYTKVASTGSKSDDNGNTGRYTVTVTNGSIGGYYAAQASIRVGNEVNIYPDIPDPELELIFDKYIATGVTLDYESKEKATFKMPANDVTINVTYKARPYIGEKAPTEAKAVGDIVFSDGSAVSCYTELTNKQKSKVIAVIFYVAKGEASIGSKIGILGAKTLGIGIHNTVGEACSWAKDKTTGFSTNFTNIQLAVEKTAPTENIPYYWYEDENHNTKYVTGDFDGSDNWAEICKQDSTAEENAAENYPAFNWVNNYATTYSLSGDYASGWYLPSALELRLIYDDLESYGSKVNKAFEKISGEEFKRYGYWSSNQAEEGASYAHTVVLYRSKNYAGTISYSNKNKKSPAVCAIRAF